MHRLIDWLSFKAGRDQMDHSFWWEDWHGLGNVKGFQADICLWSQQLMQLLFFFFFSLKSIIILFYSLSQTSGSNALNCLKTYGNTEYYFFCCMTNERLISCKPVLFCPMKVGRWLVTTSRVGQEALIMTTLSWTCTSQDLSKEQDFFPFISHLPLPLTTSSHYL